MSDFAPEASPAQDRRGPNLRENAVHVDGPSAFLEQMRSGADAVQWRSPRRTPQGTAAVSPQVPEKHRKAAIENPDTSVIPAQHPVESCSVQTTTVPRPGAIRSCGSPVAPSAPPAQTSPGARALENRVGEGVLIRPARHVRRLSGYF
jgi:hypothetical protein